MLQVTSLTAPSLTAPSSVKLSRRSRATSLLRQAYFSKRLNHWAVRAYAALHRPPYLRPAMEFETDVWNGISTFCSSRGRPIGENNAHPSLYAPVVETEHKVCRFEGSRHGLPINVTALRDVMAVWRETLQFTALVRQRYVRQRGLGDGPFTLRQGYVFSKIGAALPAFLARRGRDPLKSGSLPALETAFFTLGVGPFMVVRASMEKGDLTALHDAPLRAEQLYQVADDSGALITPAGKACAGSRKLFLELLDVAMNGTGQPDAVLPDVRRALDAVGDWHAFFDYLLASSRLELLVKLHQALCAQALAWLQAEDRALGCDTELAARVQSCLARCDQRAPSALDGDTVTRHLLQVIFALLAEMDGAVVHGALKNAAVLRTDGVVAPPTLPPGGDARRTAGRRIRVVTEIIYPLARAELDRLHHALVRYKDHRLSIDDLYGRAGGDDLQALVALLEQPALRQAACSA